MSGWVGHRFWERKDGAASQFSAGNIKVDGVTAVVDEDGVLSVVGGGGGGGVSVATSSAVGTVKPDGSTILVAGDGTLTAPPHAVNDRTDVTETSPVDLQVLSYNASASQYLNRNPYAYCFGSSVGYVGNFANGQLATTAAFIWWNNVQALTKENLGWSMITDVPTSTSVAFIAPDTGVYHIECHVVVDPSAASARHVTLEAQNYSTGAILAVGRRHIPQSSGTPAMESIQISRMLNLTAGTEVAFSVFSNVASTGSGDTVHVNNSANGYFHINQISV